MKYLFLRNKHDFLLLIAGLIATIIAVWHWFQDGYHLNFVDALMPVDKNSLYRLFYNLDPHVFPWNAESNWSWIPYWLIFIIPRELFGSISTSQLLLYIFLGFSSIASFYLFTNYLFTKISLPVAPAIRKSVSFSFSLLYTFNLYTFYYGFFMFNPNEFITAFLPLNLLALFKLFPLDGKKTQFAVVWAFAFFVSLLLMDSGFLTYIFFAQYAVWIALYLLCYIFAGTGASLRQRFTSAGIFSVLIFLSQWWWFLPAAFNFADLYAYQATIGTTRFFYGAPLPSQLLNSMRVLGMPLMAGNPFSWSSIYSDNKLFTLPLFLLPFLLLYFMRMLQKLTHQRTFLFLLVTLVISLFLVKFNNPPAAFIMGFAFEHLPFFGAFRDSFHKAGPYYLLPLMTLSSLGAGMLAFRLASIHRFFVVPLWAAIVTVGVVMTGPFFLFMNDNVRVLSFFSGNKEYTISAKTRIPPEYYDLKNKFGPECRGKIVLVVPRGGWMSSAAWQKYNDSYMALDLLKQIINCTFINTFAFKPQAEAVAEAPYVLIQNHEYAALKQFLYKHQIQFILIRKDNVPNSFTNWFYSDPAAIMEHLDTDPEYEKIDINEYFTVYRLRTLDFPNSYGFALSSSAIYTNSPLNVATDSIVVSKHSPDGIGPIVLQTLSDKETYGHAVGTYIAQGICPDCRTKDEIGRLTLGSRKYVDFALDIAQTGEYSCEGRAYGEGFAVTGSSIMDTGNQDMPIYSGNASLLQGRYTARVAYAAPIRLAENTVSITSGNPQEFPLPELTGRNYHLQYSIDSSDTSVEVILAKKKLRPEDLRRLELNPDDIVFILPAAPSATSKTYSRIIQLDEFNPKPYHLYIRALPAPPQKTSTATVRGLVFEKNIDTNHVTFACSMTQGGKTAFTQYMKVQQKNILDYSITVPNGFKSGFLTFNKNFTPGWVAYSLRDGKKHMYPHIQSGYANGWYIDSPPEGSIVVTNRQQKISEMNALVSIIVFLAMFRMYAKMERKK